MEITDIRTYLEKHGNFKCAINDPESGELKFFKVELGVKSRTPPYRDWTGRVFVKQLIGKDKIKINLSYQELIILPEILKTLPDCIKRYDRESNIYAMSKHQLNITEIINASQDIIEKIMIPVIWGRQTEDEQELRKTTDLNSIGFSKADASFFSHMKLDKIDRGIRLNEEEVENAKRRLCKYYNQLVDMNIITIA